ncbi:MAG: hypothetical protein KY475_16650, partial [Planctomycetes bacterium]|nr:hypothetical protein [Planctomycetota bacterium]
GENPAPTGHILEEHMTFLKEADPHEFELYNLREDIGETTNLAERESERAAAMVRRLTDLYHEVRSESPTWPAWEWPRYEAGRIRAGREKQ